MLSYFERNEYVNKLRSELSRTKREANDAQRRWMRALDAGENEAAAALEEECGWWEQRIIDLEQQIASFS